MSEKLKLQWVQDVIGEDYKKWHRGDVVLLQAQTGTGKTYFIKNTLIPYLEDYQTLLYVCNRTNLKRQLKIDLLNKYNKSIPMIKEKVKDENNKEIEVDTNKVDFEALDEMTKFGADNIIITSYHAIQNTIINETYGDKKYTLENYNYVIMDEVHYILTDSSFNNKCRLAYDALIRRQMPQTIKIFMSATMEEIVPPIIININNSNNFGKKPTLYKYETGIDYSYINCKYIDNNTDTLINLIKNDKTDEKWMIFVSNKAEGNKIKDKLGDDICSTIYSQTKSKELECIINNSYFNKKVLVCTKCLDNGINIQDYLLTNVVIMAWDRITFMQMLGRKRIDINNPQPVNLYILKRYKKSFSTKKYTCVKQLNNVQLLYNDKNAFNKKFDNELKKFDNINHLFYRDMKTGDYKVNVNGQVRTGLDLEFYMNMEKRFDKDGEFAYIKQQLDWLNINETFSPLNEITDVVLDEDIDTLEEYLKSIVGEKLFSSEQQKISNLIIKELTTINTGIDYRTKRLKPCTLESIIREQLELPYAVSESKKERSSKSKYYNKNYIIISKI